MVREFVSFSRDLYLFCHELSLLSLFCREFVCCGVSLFCLAASLSHELSLFYCKFCFCFAVS